MIITHEFHGQTFQFTQTVTAQALINEIFSDNYKVLEKKIEFKKGDVVLDVGANEGMFSIFISMLFPQARVIALEPVPDTFETLKANIALNKCKNIEPYNIGLGKPGQKTATLITNKSGESGGSTALCTFNPETHNKIEVGLISLDEAFDLYAIDRCRLLKMDVEGMEYDILYQSTVIPRTDFFTGEFHFNQRLDFMARRMDALAVWVSNQTKLIHLDLIRMAE